jgi:hypothetical protein
LVACWASWWTTWNSTPYNANDLVHVTYTLTTQDAKTVETSQASTDELQPAAFENNRGLYNLNNLIDFHSLTMDGQTMAGLRVRPVRLARYSDATIEVKGLITSSG